jgi:hypothetical protein
MLVMFRDYFDADLWKIFDELSYFYKQICTKQLVWMVQCDATFAIAFTLGS